MTADGISIAGTLQIVADVVAVLALLDYSRRLFMYLSHPKIRKIREATTWYKDGTLREYSNTRYGFTVKYPLRWDRQRTSANNDGVVFVDPSNQDISLTAYGTHPGVLLNVNELDKLRMYVKAKPKVKIKVDEGEDGQIRITRNKITTLSHLPGHRFEYTYENKKGRKITALEKAVFANYTTLVVIVQAPKKLWPAYKDTFDLLVKDFTILEIGGDRT